MISFHLRDACVRTDTQSQVPILLDLRLDGCLYISHSVTKPEQVSFTSGTAMFLIAPLLFYHSGEA